VWDDEPDDKRMAEFDELDDVLSTTGSAFLGLTIGCARCHDHKFDPIPQADYYSLLSFFRNIRLSEGAKYTLDSANYVPLAEPARIAAWRDAQKAKLKPLQDHLTAVTNDAEKKKLSKQIEDTKNEKPPFEWALAVRERGLKAASDSRPDSWQCRQPRSRSAARVSQRAGCSQTGAASASGRRNEHRVAAAHSRNGLRVPENPLTARVWQIASGNTTSGTAW
jgi:hypothetical protein